MGGVSILFGFGSMLLIMIGSIPCLLNGIISLLDYSKLRKDRAENAGKCLLHGVIFTMLGAPGTGLMIWGLLRVILEAL